MRPQVPTHASQCRRPSFIHRRGWTTLKEVIDRFLKGSVHKLKENAKAVPKNSKETSEDNTDVEMDLHILRVYSNVTQTCSSVHSRDKRVTGQILYTQPQRFDFFILAWNINTLPSPAANSLLFLLFLSLAFLKLAFIYMLLLRYDWSTNHTFPSRIKDNEITAWA